MKSKKIVVEFTPAEYKLLLDLAEQNVLDGEDQGWDSEKDEKAAENLVRTIVHARMNEMKPTLSRAKKIIR